VFRWPRSALSRNRLRAERFLIHGDVRNPTRQAAPSGRRVTQGVRVRVSSAQGQRGQLQYCYYLLSKYAYMLSKLKTMLVCIHSWMPIRQNRRNIVGTGYTIHSSIHSIQSHYFLAKIYYYTAAYILFIRRNST
jgi:hypothetical protein